MKSLLFFPAFVVVAILLASCGGGSSSSSSSGSGSSSSSSSGGPVAPKLSVAASTGDEKSGVTFNLILDKALVDDISFKYRIEAGTAGQADFASTVQLDTEIEGTIDIGEITLDIVIDIEDDGESEPDENFSLILSKVTGATFDPAENTLTARGTIAGDYADSNDNGLIEIGTSAEMNNVRYNLTGTSYKTSETDTGNSGGCPVQGCGGYELRGNIDLSSISDWVPIGNFNTTFDGKGYTISNINISSSASYVGLFAKVFGTIKNLNLRSGSITQTGASKSSVGAVAGRLESGGTIDNVSTDLAVNNGYFVGGLVGYNAGIVQNSYATGIVNGKVRLGDLVEFNLGGLVGYSKGEIQRSWASGAVTGGAGNSDRVGGLVGAISKLSKDIHSSYATGDVKDEGGLYNNVGGLVGDSDAGIQNSYAIGDVTAGGSGDRVGGLVGYSYSGTIQNGYATGDVRAGDVTAGGDIAGGLVGYVYNGIIRNGYATGDVRGGGGTDNVGRVVGKNESVVTIFGNYYLEASILSGETKRTIATDEVVGKDADGLKALTATITGTDFTSTDTTDGWSTNNWDFTATKYPSLKSYKVDRNDAQVEGDLLCGQGTDWVQCPSP